MVRVLLAPDKFKGTLTAAEVAGHLRAGILEVRPDAEIAVAPVADGGDGLLDAAAEVGYEEVRLTAAGALGDLAPARYVVRAGVGGTVGEGSTAVVEMAEICGLARLAGRREPLTASSRGLGEAVAHALDAGATEVLVGIGGSASTDGGAGMLTALGVRLLDDAGQELGPGGAELARLASIDLSGLHRRLAEVEMVAACDVDNPLTGPKGAAAVYGPQKGADPAQVEQLDAALTHLADVVAATTGQDHRDVPGAGAAGGVGFALVSVLGARLRPGVEVVLELTGFQDALPGSDLVVTGEGALDEQTLHGKAPAGVADAARAAGIPVVAVAGQLLLSQERLAAAGIERGWAIAALARDPDESFQRPGPLLVEVGRQIGATLP